MTLLEQRYRYALRLLPPAYRAAREEEMVAAFLELYGDAPDETNSRPPWAELASVAALAARVRLSWTPRAAAWGQALRLLALLGLGLQAAIATTTLVSLPFFWNSEYDSGVTLVLSAAELSWILAFAALTRGRIRAAKTLTLAGLAVELIQITGPLWLAGMSRLIQSTGSTGPAWLAEAAGKSPAELFEPVDHLPFLLVIGVPVVALLLGQHRAAPPVRRRWWPLAVVVVSGPLHVWVLNMTAWRMGSPPWIMVWMDSAGYAALLVIVAAVPTLLTRSPGLTLAVAALGVTTLAARALSDLSEPLTTAFAIQLSLVATATAVLWVAGTRGLPTRAEESGSASGR